MPREEDDIAASMQSIRSRGPLAADRLQSQMTRLTDWREHVRSTPIPFVVAAVSLGYFLVPTRNSSKSEQSRPVVLPALNGHSLQQESVFNRIAGSIRIRIATGAERWLSNWLTNLATQQILRLKENRIDNDGHAEQVDEQTYQP